MTQRFNIDYFLNIKADATRILKLLWVLNKIFHQNHKKQFVAGRFRNARCDLSIPQSICSLSAGLWSTCALKQLARSCLIGHHPGFVADKMGLICYHHTVGLNYLLSLSWWGDCVEMKKILKKKNQFDQNAMAIKL